MRRLLVLISLLLGGSFLSPALGAIAQEVAGTPATSGTASSSLAGNALPLLSSGEPGVVDVIAVGAPVKWDVPIVLRNNTDETLVLTTIHGTAHDTTGELLATGEPGAFMSPTVLPAGQVAISAVYFNSLEYLPPDAVLAFQAETEPLATARVFRQDLEIVEATRGERAIVGLAQNRTEEPLVGKVNVIGVCFDATGAVTGFSFGFADKLDLDPGETVPIEVPFADTGPCEAFLVGANGYKKP